MNSPGFDKSTPGRKFDFQVPKKTANPEYFQLRNL
jgi:hypothetical protein